MNYRVTSLSVDSSYKKENIMLKKIETYNTSNDNYMMMPQQCEITTNGDIHDGWTCD